MKLSGGCLCGQVRYQAEAEPVFVGVCHCRNCQKQTGSAFNIVVAVPKPALSVAGVPRTYDDRGDSGKVLSRSFCPQYGSTLFDEAEAMPGVMMISAGTLDDASGVKPTMEIFCDSAQPWVALGGDQKRFPRMPG
ncbi:MAG: GFA family protein [Stellaceae bacterium]